jgi:hypothetical protein
MVHIVARAGTGERSQYVALLAHNSGNKVHGEVADEVLGEESGAGSRKLLPR